MITDLTVIANFIIDAFVHIWPYLLVTIPLAVAVRMSGASKYINDAFKTRPMVAIFLATFVGAFSPFCSCGVIPVAGQPCRVLDQLVLEAVHHPLPLFAIAASQGRRVDLVHHLRLPRSSVTFTGREHE